MLTTVSDRKLAVDDNTDDVIDYYLADIQSSTDYYAFGMPMPGRQFNSNTYRYGFNGKENDSEVKGAGDSYDLGARIYDPRIGRWLSLDPLQAKYPELPPVGTIGGRR